MSTRRPAVRSTRKSGGIPIQTWQIILLVIAAVAVVWALTGYIGEQRRLSDVKYTQGPEKNPYKEGTKAYERFRDKDEGR